MDFNFDVNVLRDGPDMTPKKFSKKGHSLGHGVTP